MMDRGEAGSKGLGRFGERSQWRRSRALRVLAAIGEHEVERDVRVERHMEGMRLGRSR